MMKSSVLLLLPLWTFLGASSVASAQQTQTDRAIIERIDIRGNRRIPEDTIRFYIQSRQGEVFDEGRLELDLRALFKTTFFENVQIEEQDGETGKIVTFTLKERPLIRSITYEGAKSFTESNILEHFKTRKVGLTVDSQYDPSKIRMAERALLELMEQNGRPLGVVRSEIEEVPPSSVRVKFVLNEGAKVRIGRIRFTGNKIFSDGQLQDALKLTKERGMISLFKGTDKYHYAKLQADIEMNLKAFYKQHGYMQVQVGEPATRIFEGPRGFVPVFRKTKQQFFVEIPIDAGDQYRLGELKLENCGIFKCDSLVNSFQLRKGDVVNFKKVKDALENLKKLYGNYGYINWSYIPETSFDPESRTMDMIFKLEPSKQFSVHRIQFLGNTKTRDKVIRREVVLEEGRAFSTQLMDVSILRLNQLGFFEKIEEKDYEVKPNDKSEDVDITINVKEKSQQSIGLHGGVSGISGSFLGVNYTTNNFMGRGESLEFSVTGGTRTSDFIISFTEPYLLDSRWNLGLSVFNQRYRFDTYSAFGLAGVISNEPIELFTRRTTGSTVSVSRPLGLSFWRLGASYTYQKISIGNIAPGFEAFALGQLVYFAPGGDPTAALEGIIRSEFTPMISYNSTNHYFYPTRGSSLNLSVAIAGGPLGGDFSMFRPAIEFRHFRPDKWISRGRNTIGLRFLGEYIQPFNDSAVPFFDRFFIGGETTVRGFDIRSVSPLAISSTPALDSQDQPVIDLNSGLERIDKNIVSIGGDTLAVFNTEYRIPIVGPLSVAGFYDLGLSRISRQSYLGNVANSSIELIDATNNVIRGSTGVEVQFLLPVVSAPFRLIFAYNTHIFDETIYLGTVPIHAREPRRDIKFTIGRSF
jgi:outer membrane protein insertion porin family